MGIPSIPKKAALVVSVIYGKGPVRDEAIRLLEKSFGPGMMHPEPLRFDTTDYYRAEMGWPLHRVIWMADAVFGRNRLSAVKLATNGIERQLAKRDGARRVNLDPGLLTAENFILATTKNYAHRVYLRKGIFADLTLVYRKGGYMPLEWTYPDYATEELRNILKTLRNTYMNKHRQ